MQLLANSKDTKVYVRPQIHKNYTWMFASVFSMSFSVAQITFIHANMINSIWFFNSFIYCVTISSVNISQSFQQWEVINEKSTVLHHHADKTSFGLRIILQPELPLRVLMLPPFHQMNNFLQPSQNLISKVSAIYNTERTVVLYCFINCSTVWNYIW